MTATNWIHRGLVLLVCLWMGLNPAATFGAAGKVEIRGSVPDNLRMAGQPLARLEGNRQLDLAIELPLRRGPELAALLQRLYDPSSPEFRHYLTATEFTEQYGPTVEDYESVIAFARSNQLTLTARHQSRLLVRFRGRADDVERAFGVTLRTYRHPTETRSFFAPETEPKVPVGLAVHQLTGLTDFARLRPLGTHLLQPARLLPNGASGYQGYYAGKDFRTAYAPGVASTGTGQKVGLFEADGYYAADIATYAKLAGQSSVTLSNVLVDGFSGAPGAANGEVALDIEMAIAMAPGLASVVVFEGPGTVANWMDILTQMAQHTEIKQFSSSWGYTGGSNPNLGFDQVFQKMAAQGQSFFQAAGDGDAWTNPIQVPAASPYVTVVGGTCLAMNGSGVSYASETVWNSGLLANGWGANGLWGAGGAGYWGSGGGVSAQYPLPWWQTNVNTTANQASAAHRNIPDVAMTASNIFLVFSNGYSAGVLGTSCAAPLWAGFTALANQQAAAAGRAPVGFLNPALYAIGRGANYSACFHDITVGNNAWAGSGGKYNATTGYDLCTGWGTPAGAALLPALATGAAGPYTNTATFFTNLVAGYAITYGTASLGVSGTVTADVLALGPVYPTNGESVNVTLNGVTTHATINNTTGGFSLSLATAGLPVTASGYPLTYTYAGDTFLAGATNRATVLTVNAATPALAWAKPAAVVYGTPLGGGQLNASAGVPGQFAYTPAGGTILPAGTNLLKVVFSPTDANDYLSVTGSVSWVVLPAGPTLTWTTPAPMGYGTPLGANQLNATANVAGQFAYTPTNGTILPAGTNSLKVVFTPTDGTDYLNATGSVNWVVLRATPTLTWTNPTPVVYGTPLGTNQLNALANVPGRFAYSPTNGTVAPAGTNRLTAIFTPTDTNNYLNATGSVSLVVLPAAPMLTWTNPSPVVYGTLLDESQLNATANVPGQFAYNPTNGTALPAGTNLLSVSFTPADTNDYAVVATSVTLVVVPATPMLTWTDPAPVVYGTPLDTNQLNATAKMPGTLVYSPTNGAVLPAGINLLTVTFTPDDTNDYAVATAGVNLLVLPATPVLTWINPAPLVYGTPLDTNQLNATANVPGSLVYSSTHGAVLPAGTNLLTVSFTPDDTNDYAVATAGVSLVVLPAAPTLTWTNPEPVVYGTALNTNQLNATADVPGTLVYTPTNGAILPAGTNTLTVTFTPTDTNDYAIATADVGLVVLPATPLLTWSNPAPVVFGTPLDANQLNATANVAGTWVYNPANGAILPAGTYILVVTFIPTDTNDYAMAAASVGLVVLPAAPVLTWTNPAPVFYGTALDTNQLNATANVPGALLYNPTNGAVLPAGTNLLAVIFTPTDTNDYAVAAASVSLVVLPATPMLTWTNPAAVVYGTPLDTNQLNATADVPGLFAYNPTNGAVLPAGTNILGATFTPADTNDYLMAAASVSLVVLPATPLLTWTNPAPLVFGTPLDTNQLNASADVPGLITYNPSNGTVLLAGTNWITASFTPTDTNDYSMAAASVSLVVLPATPMLTWTNPAPVCYGTPLDTNQLNATANVPGTLVYSPGNGAVLPAGTNILTVTFTPTDTNDYTGTTGAVSLFVLPAIAPVILGGVSQGDAFLITWSAISNQSYAIQTTTDLSTGNWLDVGGPLTASNSVMTATVSMGTNQQQFVRVVLRFPPTGP